MTMLRQTKHCRPVDPPDPPEGGFYETTFSVAENPSSESGAWLNAGGAVAQYWDPVASSDGLGHASQYIASGYTDNVGIIDPTYMEFGPNQVVRGIIYKDSGHTPTNTHECQLVLRCNFGDDHIDGIEVLLDFSGSYPLLMKWYGPGGGGFFEEITDGFNAIGYQDGDEIIAQITNVSGNPYVEVFRKRGADIVLWSWGTDDGTTLSGAPKCLTGQPGRAHFVRAETGQDYKKFCLTYWSASDDITDFVEET
jgi:hypothetical protein